jgi:hypothetical protein
VGAGVGNADGAGAGLDRVGDGSGVGVAFPGDGTGAADGMPGARPDLGDGTGAGSLGLGLGVGAGAGPVVAGPVEPEDGDAPVLAVSRPGELGAGRSADAGFSPP